MKHAIASIIFAAIASQSYAGLVISGSDVVEITPPASTGLEAVYVVRDIHGIKVSHDSGKAVKWSKFSSYGAAYAEEIGVSVSIEPQAADAGYVAELDGRSYYFWIVNYADHELSLNSVSVPDEQPDCNRTELHINGSGDRMVYYTINGRGEELDRGIKISYTTLSYDASSGSYHQTETVEDLAYLRPTVSVAAPLCDTRFTVSGDRFLQAWHIGEEIGSPHVPAHAVEAETTATQERREVDNEQTSGTSDLGGSAPCEVEFSAIATDAAVFYEWQLSRDSEFDEIDDRYSQTDFSYVFREQGTYYVRFFAANVSGQCDFTGPVYTVSIGASNLLCPNAFTPESSPGVNDEWKVSYKSIVSFECHIFNRWGVEMCSFTDPSLGWDGKYNGKYVPAGTYYYVIKARGADGRVYNLSGDINIVKSTNNSSSESVE